MFYKAKGELRYRTLLFGRLSIVFLLNLISHQVFAEATGTFMVVKGDVQVTSKAGTTQKAKIGMKVQESDIIASGADSRAKIVMSDKNVINISPDTKLELEKYVYDPNSDNKQVSLNVLQGKVRATVEQKYDGEKNKFHVKTPSAVAGVRGTDFLTSFSASNRETKIVTFEGKVAVGLPGPNGSIANPVFVNPGQTTTAQGGSPPNKPQPVPANELNNMKSESQADSAKGNDKKDTSANSESKEEKKDEQQVAKDEAKEEKKDEQQAAKDEQRDDKKASTEEPKEDKPVAKDEPKVEPKEERSIVKDEPREDKQATPAEGNKENRSSANNEPSPSQGGDGSPPPSAREPASANNAPPPGAGGPGGGSATPPMGGMGSMINTADLMPSMGNTVVNPNLLPVLPTTNFEPTIAPPITQITDRIPQETINNATTNTTSRVNVIINKK
jgi:hypothetical protein